MPLPEFHIRGALRITCFVVVSVENVPHRLLCLNTWFPAGSTGLETFKRWGLTGSRRSWKWGDAWKFQSPIPIHVNSFLPDCRCTMTLLLLPSLPYDDGGVPQTIRQNKSFLLEIVTYLAFYPSNETSN